MRLFKVTIVPIAGERAISTLVMAIDPCDAFGYFMDKAGLDFTTVSGFTVAPVDYIVSDMARTKHG